MAPQPTPVPSDEALPTKSDVVIIGGGIIGVTTALELAEQGIDVTLLEKGIIAGEQSSRNWGWVRQMGRDPVEIPLIVKSTQIWKDLARRINAQTGYTQCGITYLLNDEKSIAHYTDWSKTHAAPGGIKSQIIGPEKIAQLFPHSQANWRAALYTADDGRAEPQLAAPAIALAARRRGAKIFTHCAVRGLEKEAGKVAGVVTEKGAIKTSTVLLAGGAWSRHFCQRVGITLPQLTIISSVLRTAPIDGPEITASGEMYTFRKRLDGGYTITPDFTAFSELTPAHFRHFFEYLPLARKNAGQFKLGFNKRFFTELAFAFNKRLDKVSPFEKVRIFDPEPTHSLLDEAVTHLKKDFPVFENFQTIERWAGCIDVMPDEVPVIDAVSSLPGFFIATGFSGHGFGIGPGAGLLASQIITGQPTCVDPRPFAYARFAQ